MSEHSDDRPTRELRPTEVQTLLRGPQAVNLEVELDVEGAPAHVIDDGSSLAIAIVPAPPVRLAAGSTHALATAGGPAQRARIAMRALTSRTLRYPRAPDGPPLSLRILAIIVALLAAYVAALITRP